MSPWCDWGTGCEGPQRMSVGCGTGQGSRWSLRIWGVREEGSVLATSPVHRDVPQGLGLSLEVTTEPLRRGGRTTGHMEGPHWQRCKTQVGFREWFPGSSTQERESGGDGTAWGDRLQNKGDQGGWQQRDPVGEPCRDRTEMGDRSKPRADTPRVQRRWVRRGTVGRARGGLCWKGRESR